MPQWMDNMQLRLTRKRAGVLPKALGRLQVGLGASARAGARGHRATATLGCRVSISVGPFTPMAPSELSQWGCLSLTPSLHLAAGPQTARAAGPLQLVQVQVDGVPEGISLTCPSSAFPKFCCLQPRGGWCGPGAPAAPVGGGDLVDAAQGSLSAP